MLIPTSLCVPAPERYVEASVWAGSDQDVTPAGSVRAGAGIVYRGCSSDGLSRGVDLRLGLTVVALIASTSTTRLAGEAELTWPIADTWRVGPHLGAAPDPTLLSFGIRARHDTFSFGAELVDTSVLLGIGFER